MISYYRVYFYLEMIFVLKILILLFIWEIKVRYSIVVSLVVCIFRCINYISLVYIEFKVILNELVLKILFLLFSWKCRLDLEYKVSLVLCIFRCISKFG